MSLPTQEFTLYLPDGYTGAAAPLCLYHGGWGETSSAPRTDTLKTALIAHLLANGYIIAASNAHGNNWGNDDALADYLALYRLAAQELDISRTVLLSQSAGGSSGLLTLTAQVVPALGWAGIYPGCSLQDLYDNNETFAASIRTAYGIAGDGSDYATKTAGHDPLLTAAAAYAGLRLRFYASPDDNSVDKTANADALSSHVSAQATEYTVVACTGDHGDPSHFQNADLLSFFDRCV